MGAIGEEPKPNDDDDDECMLSSAAPASAEERKSLPGMISSSAGTYVSKEHIVMAVFVVSFLNTTYRIDFVLCFCVSACIPLLQGP